MVEEKKLTSNAGAPIIDSPHQQLLLFANTPALIEDAPSEIRFVASATA